MHPSPAARRAARLFWRVMGSSLLVATGMMLVWRFGNRHASSLTVFDTCWMMMRQFWGISPEFAESRPFVSALALLLMVSGAWAGWRSLTLWWRTRRLFMWSTPYCPGRWPGLDAALATLPYVRRLRTLTASHPVACTVGLWQPQIVLSADLIATLSPAELRAVIGHEWGHVCRRDPLRLALLQFCSRALWFLPIVRAFAQDSARHMEDAADDAAVALTRQPLDLASALVKTAKAHVRPRSPSPALGGQRAVSERVERLLQVAPTRPPQRHTWAWSASIAVTACLVGLSILSRQPVATAASALPFIPQHGMVLCSTHTAQRS